MNEPMPPPEPGGSPNGMDPVSEFEWWECPVPDPDAALTYPARVIEAAYDYIAAGLSVVPIANDGSKMPDWRRLPRRWDVQQQCWKRSWKEFQGDLPTADDLETWLGQGGGFGLAVVAGAVSGGVPGHGLEIVDFDTADLYAGWAAAVELQAPGLPARLVQVQSPRPGRHLYYRCPIYGGSEKLACAPLLDGGGAPVVEVKSGRVKRITLIELKGEGGYCLVPPSPRSCHRTGRRYLPVEGSPPLTEVPIITPEERQVILDAARAYNCWQEPVTRSEGKPLAGPRPAVPRNPNRGTGRPGDDFSNHAEWADILEPHGWAFVSQSGGVTYWRRPGKSDGTSATTGFCEGEDGRDLLYVFSSNAEPLEVQKPYNKFAAYACLNHDGDFRAAAGALRELGYGERLPLSPRRPTTYPLE